MPWHERASHVSSCMLEKQKLQCLPSHARNALTGVTGNILVTWWMSSASCWNKRTVPPVLQHAGGGGAAVRGRRPRRRGTAGRRRPCRGPPAGAQCPYCNCCWSTAPTCTRATASAGTRCCAARTRRAPSCLPHPRKHRPGPQQAAQGAQSASRVAVSAIGLTPEVGEG